MAKITVTGEISTVTISEPDEDGHYSYVCQHGHTPGDWAWQPLEDMIQAAEMHADHQCEGAK